MPLLSSASEYVNVIGSDVFIKHDATSSFETDWAATLETLASGISFERTTVGSVQVEFSLKDGLEAGSNTSVKTFSFAREFGSSSAKLCIIRSNDTSW